MFQQIMKDISERVPASKEDEVFLGEDGLLYCKKCGGARECIPAKSGRFAVKVGCLCPCQAEAEKIKTLQLKTDMSDAEIRKARQLASIDPSFKDHTFENDNGSQPLMKQCRKYAADFPRHLKNHSGLLIYGNCGSGKSYAADCIANSVLNQGYAAIVTSFAKIAETVGNIGYEGRGEYYDSLMKVPLLIIDDLGAERDTEYMMEIIHRVIDDRDKSQKPLIITTNFTMEDIKNPRNDAWARIWSRIIRNCYPLHFEGDDVRFGSGFDRNVKMKKYYG